MGLTGFFKRKPRTAAPAVTSPSTVTGDAPVTYGWVVIGVLFLIDALGMGMTFTLGLMLPSISTDLGIDLRQVGWLGAVNWWVGAILTLPLAFRFARFSPKKTVIISCLFQGILLFAQGLAPNYWVLLGARIAFMASGLVRFSANSLLIQQWFPRSRFALVNTVAIVCSGVVGGSVVFFMGRLIDVFNGWRNVFFIFGGIEAVVLIAWLVLAKERPLPAPEPDTGKPAGVKTVLKNKMLWLLGIGVAGDLMCFGALETLWPKFATSLGFISLDQAGYCEGLSYYGFTVGSLLGGLLTMKLGRRKPAIWLSGLVIPFVTLGILFSRSFPMLAFLWAMWGIAELYSPIVNTIPYELSGIKPREVPIALAFVHTIVAAGAGLGPVVGSYLAGLFGSLERALLVMCTLPVLLFITGLIIKETGPGTKARVYAGPPPLKPPALPRG